MSSFTPSSPEPSKCTATKVIPASVSPSHSARMATLASACSGGSACCMFDGSFSMGFSFQLRELGCGREPQSQDRDFTFYCRSTKRNFGPQSLVPSEEEGAPDDH